MRNARATESPLGQAGGARFVRRISPKPTTYLTGEDLYQIAAIKFEEAAATPEGSARQQILIQPTTSSALRERRAGRPPM
jgi:hypothetical protein